MTDERQGKPSASGIERMSLCPGSWQAEQGLLETPNPDSESGIRIHAHLAGDAVQLVGDETTIAQSLAVKEQDIINDVFQTAYGCYREKRFWHPHGKYSCKVDAVRFWHDAALITDYKTGRNEVEIAEGNLQLRAQVPIIAHAFNVQRVYAAIIPAFARATVVLYAGDDIKRAEDETLKIIDAAEQPNAPRTPGEKQCRYCRARTACPERLHAMGDVSPMLPVVQSKGLPVLPSSDLANYLDKIPMVERICEDLKAEAKRRLQSGEDVPGWTLAHKKPREVITDLPIIHARAEKLGISTEDFTAACSLTKTAAKLMLFGATGKKGKALDAELDALIDECTEPGKTPEPSLEKLTEPLHGQLLSH